MKHRHGIIKTVKTHKMVSLIVAALVVVSGVGTAVAFYPGPEPKKVVTEQSTSVEPKKEPVEKAVVEQTVPQGSQQQEQEEAPVEEPEKSENPYAENTPAWYVWGRRADINRPLPGGLGSGPTWDDRAFAMGLIVDKTPEVGAVAVDNYGCFFVEAINADGSVTVSYLEGTTKTFSAEVATTSVRYIH